METTNTILWEEKNSIEVKKNLKNNPTNVLNDTTKETKNASVKKECENIGNEKKWKRNCPKCNKELFYKNKYILNRAIKLNKNCYSCIASTKGIRHIKEMCVGKKFYRLTIVKQYVGNNNKTKVNCICDCGTEKTTELSRLRKGHVKSCGCYRVERTRQNASIHFKRKEYGESSFNNLYSAYKNGAIKRNYDFNISKEFSKILFLGNCFYCGKPPSNKIKQKNSYGEFIYNGIDRKDNTLGYTIDNCVSCCSFCNYTKNDTSFKDFIKWIRVVNQNTSTVNL